MPFINADVLAQCISEGEHHVLDERITAGLQGSEVYQASQASTVAMRSDLYFGNSCVDNPLQQLVVIRNAQTSFRQYLAESVRITGRLFSREID